MLVHDHPEHQCRVALMADAIAGRVFVTAADAGHIGDAQHLAVGHHGYVLDQRQGVESAIDTDVGTRPGGLDNARRRHTVLRRQGGEDLLRLDAEGGQALIGEFDEHALRLFAEDIDLLHSRQAQKALAQILGHLHQLPVRQVLGLQGIEGEIDVGILVVEKRPEHATRQPGHLVTEFLAGLVEKLRQVARPGRFVESHFHRNKARLGNRLDPVVEVQFLQALFQAVGHLLLHFPGRGAGPGGGDGHDLDGEGRVFGTAQFAEGEDTGKDHGDNQEQGHRRVAHGDLGEVEAAHANALLRLAAPGPIVELAAGVRCRLRAASGRPGRRCAGRCSLRL
ncbi:hypothetical protein D9M71_244480 [compost metagenome]